MVVVSCPKSFRDGRCSLSALIALFALACPVSVCLQLCHVRRRCAVSHGLVRGLPRPARVSLGLHKHQRRRHRHRTSLQPPALPLVGHRRLERLCVPCSCLFCSCSYQMPLFVNRAGSKPCGSGSQTRSVTCRMPAEAPWFSAESNGCTATKPATSAFFCPGLPLGSSIPRLLDCPQPNPATRTSARRSTGRLAPGVPALPRQAQLVHSLAEPTASSFSILIAVRVLCCGVCAQCTPPGGSSGTQTATVSCINSITNQAVDECNCFLGTKPASSRNCNTQVQHGNSSVHRSMRALSEAPAT